MEQSNLGIPFFTFDQLIYATMSHETWKKVVMGS